MNTSRESLSNPVRIGVPALLLVLAGCAVVPTGPSMMALPGTGKSFDQFRADDAACRQYAYQQIGATTQAAEQAAVQSAVVGTAIGAVAGAAFGGSRGAAVGAGSGLIVGSAAGSQSYAYGYQGQRAFDQAYMQCMYAAGHRVPVYGSFSGASGYQGAPASGLTPPPPPAGRPPPPPPGVAPR